jgi:DNA-binding phage protein
MRVLEAQDVVSLLRSEIERAGGVGLWAEKTGVHRSVVSKVLSNMYPPTKSIIKALKLRAVFVADSK